MEVACNLAPFAAASNNNLNPIVLQNDIMDENNDMQVVDNRSTSAKSVSQQNHHLNNTTETNGNLQQQNTNGSCSNNKYNNLNNNIFVREEVQVNYDENHRVIEKSVTTTFVNKNHHQHRVKFIDEENMNSNLTASQPLVVNGHINDLQSLEHSQKLANSHPHVTISSSDSARNEDRTFGTKIDNSYQGWDNPFRPEGELSHDAEEILRLWKEGKLKDFSLLLKAKEEKIDEENQDDTTDSAKKPLLNQGQQQQNGVSNAVKNGVSSDYKPPPIKSEKVTHHDEPKKKKGCCSLM